MTLLRSIEECFAFRDFLGKVAEIQETLGNLKNKAQGAESLADGVTNGVYQSTLHLFAWQTWKERSEKT